MKHSARGFWIALGAPLAWLCAACCAPHASSTADALVIQSHRGAGDLAPENTLPTFELGWRIGTIPEADVRLSRDGVPVAFHDETFERLVKDAPADLRKRGVSDLTWAELSRLDVGAYKGPSFAGERIPSIADVFAAMRHRPERQLYLDIKNVPMDQLAALAREHQVTRQVIVASTKEPHLHAWKQLVPESQTLLWMNGTEAKLNERLTRLRADNFKDVHQVQIHVKVGDLGTQEPFTPSSAFLRAVAEDLHARGLLFQTLPLGCRDPAVYPRLMSLGVDSFATDDPKTAVRAARAYLERGAQHHEPGN